MTKNSVIQMNNSGITTLADLQKNSGYTTYTELLEFVKNNTMAATLYDAHGKVLHVFPILGNNLPIMDINLLRAKGWSLSITHAGGIAYTAISHSYWCCGCETDFVHSKVITKCDKCAEEVDGRLGYLEDFLDGSLYWKFIVGDEKMKWTEEVVLQKFADNDWLKVTFTKADGSTRVMVCTRKPELDPGFVPPVVVEGEEKKERKPVPGLCNVYEYGVGWRSFYYAKIDDVEITDID